MNRWSTKYLVMLPLLAACDDPLALEGGADAGGTEASDVLVVRFDGGAHARDEPAVAFEALHSSALRSDARPGPDSAPETLISEPPVEPEPSKVPDGTRWLVDGGRLVLAQGEAATAESLDGWEVEAGDPKGDALFVARRPLAADEVRSELAALAGVEVKVYDHTREVCVARIAGVEHFALTAELVHFPDAWSEEEPAPTPTHDAADIVAQGTSLVEAPLVPLMGDCAQGLWAAPVEAPRPFLFREAAASPKLVRRAIAAFRALPAWRAAQKEMEDAAIEWGEVRSGQRLGRWDTLRGARPEVTLYRADRGEREVAVVRADSYDGCGSEGQKVVSIFDVVHEGKSVRFVELASLPWAEVPAGIVDLEGDGVLELFSGDAKGSPGVVIERWHADRPLPSEQNEWQDERYERVDGFEVPDITVWGCPC